MTFYFPIVFLPEGASCICCIQQKPFVILAMLVASSSANERLQAACDLTFRNVLARKVIVEGKRNLELLQGLLIYLAWHHHYLRHETQQIYQYLQLAIGMVVDLGLNKPQSKQRPLPSLSQSCLSLGGFSTEGATAEEDRALLGCYSLSCGLAVLGFDKPQNLAYTEHLRRCGQNLADHGCYDTDRDWLPTIDLLHIAEEIQGSSRTGAEAGTGSGMARAHVRDVEQQLQCWKYRSLTGTRDHTRLSLTFHFVQIYLYEKALSEERSMQSQLVQLAENTSMPTAGAPMLLLSTLHATQAFLDDILVKPASLLRNMNIVEWTHLIIAAITLARLARLRPDQTRETGIDHLQIKAEVEMYILTLGKRMSDLGVGNVQNDASGLFSWFKAIAHGIRLWVSGPDESAGPEHAEAENEAQSMDSSAISAFETVKSLTLQNESNQQGSGTNKGHTTDRNHMGNAQATLSDNCEMVQDDNFWDIFISNWPHVSTLRSVPSVSVFRICPCGRPAELSLSLLRVKIQNLLSCTQIEYSETFFRIQSKSETMIADCTGRTDYHAVRSVEGMTRAHFYVRGSLSLQAKAPTLPFCWVRRKPEHFHVPYLGLGHGNT
jgi:hypothetical protein